MRLQIARRVVLAGLVALGLTLTCTKPSAVAAPTPHESLPMPAQAVISGVLGRDTAAYHTTAHGPGLRLTNPRHGLTADLTSTGLSLHVGAATWGLRYQGAGYGTPTPSPAVAPLARANRVEYQRGTVTEWYVNGPMGIEQGFTLAAPPGPRTEGPLTLILALSGTLHARVEPGQTGLTLSRPDGSVVLAYRGLTAWDATGRALPARLLVQGQELRLQIEDAGAQYPLVVDPFVQQATLTASDGAYADYFGISVGISGDTVVVGAYQADVGATNQGAAYVFTRAGGVWSEQAKLTASDGAAEDDFGVSVAISGDTVVVGVPDAIIGSHNLQGAAYVFTRAGGVWSEQAKLTASDGIAGDWFGRSVAISGDTVVVGVPDAGVGATNQGVAYVFVKPGADWATMTQTAKLTASDGANGANFGFSVAISGDTIVVGAPYVDSTPYYNDDPGAAYVFVKPGIGWTTMTEAAKLTASDWTTGANSGVVAINGDTVVVGAMRAFSSQGAAYVYVFGSGYTLTVTPTGTGSGTVTSAPSGIDCGATCAVSFADGTLVTLTATPNAGSVFTGWSGDPDCSDGSVTMDAAKSCTATFTLIPPTTYLLTVATAGTGSGTVTGTGIACPGDCTESYNSGTVVGLTATPATGSSFTGFSGDADCTDGSVTLGADKICTATFALTSLTGPDLTGVWNPVSQRCRMGRCRLQGSVQVVNQGNATAPISLLRVILSDDAVLDPGDPVLKEMSTRSLRRGRTIRVRVLLSLGVNPSGKYLFAVIDPLNSVAETNESDNVVSVGPLP